MSSSQNLQSLLHVNIVRKNRFTDGPVRNQSKARQLATLTNAAASPTSWPAAEYVKWRKDAVSEGMRSRLPCKSCKQAARHRVAKAQMSPSLLALLRGPSDEIYNQVLRSFLCWHDITSTQMSDGLLLQSSSHAPRWIPSRRPDKVPPACFPCQLFLGCGGS